MRTSVPLLLGLLLASASAADQAPLIPLWADGAPGSESRKDEPVKVEGSNISNVHNPSITAYLPAGDNATDTAVLIAPGGGHRVLCLGHEGDALAQWFADRGIAAFVLRYRLCREEGSNYTLEGHAMDDTRRAIRTAAPPRWRMEAEPTPHRYHRVLRRWRTRGLLGDAIRRGQGGCQRSDRTDEQPPGFPGPDLPGKVRHLHRPQGHAPRLHRLRVQRSPGYLHRHGQSLPQIQGGEVPCEMHVYANAGHGFGYRPGTTSAAGDWPERFCEWLTDGELRRTRRNKTSRPAKPQAADSAHPILHEVPGMVFGAQPRFGLWAGIAGAHHSTPSPTQRARSQVLERRTPKATSAHRVGSPVRIQQPPARLRGVRESDKHSHPLGTTAEPSFQRDFPTIKASDR